MAGSGSRLSIGDVLYLHDHITRFSNKNVRGSRARWQRRAGGGSLASRRNGVFTPARAMPEFDLPGYFWPSSRRISSRDAASARNIGKLPERYLRQVLAQFRQRRRKT
jgi:hypothetical protein